jgi:hypothetical protein
MKKHLIAVEWLVLALLLVARLAAQNADFDKIATEALPAAPMQTAPVPSSAKPGKVFDKKFFAIMGSLGGAESFRFTSRQLVLDHEFAAGAPWVTNPPPNRPIMLKGLAVYGAEFLLTYELKKSHSWLSGDRVIRKVWWAYPAAMAVIHIKNAVGNVRITGQGGCTSVECATQMQ